MLQVKELQRICVTAGDSDEGVRLGRVEAVEAIRPRFPNLESESSSSGIGNTNGSGV